MISDSSLDAAILEKRASDSDGVWKLMLRGASILSCDLVAATTAAFFVSPIVAIVDRVVVEAARPLSRAMAKSASLRLASKASRSLCLAERRHASPSRKKRSSFPCPSSSSSSSSSFSTAAPPGRSFGSLFIRGVSSAARNPKAFAKSAAFSRVLCVYAGTFLAANGADSVSDALESESKGTFRFLSASFANTVLCLRKDIALARLYGSRCARSAAFPSIAILLLLARDALTVAAAFNLPPLLAQMLHSAKLACERKEKEELQPRQKRRTGSCVDGETDEGTLVTAQLLAPLLVQIISTPLHLLALSLFNDSAAKQEATQKVAFQKRTAKLPLSDSRATMQTPPTTPIKTNKKKESALAVECKSRPPELQTQRNSLTSHVQVVKRLYVQTLGARMLRVLPAFGFGGLVNGEVRNFLRQRILLLDKDAYDETETLASSQIAPEQPDAQIFPGNALAI